MAAIRLGAAKTNVSGTSGQILRVSAGETGFEFYSPAGIPAYTITNDSTDRAMSAIDVSLDELTNVVSTLIKDLSTLLGSVAPSGTGFTIWDSQYISHPEQSNDAVNYSLVHNKGKQPVFGCLMVRDTPVAGAFAPIRFQGVDRAWNNSYVYGFDLFYTDANTQRARVYRVGGGTSNIIIRLYFN